MIQLDLPGCNGAILLLYQGPPSQHYEDDDKIKHINYKIHQTKWRYHELEDNFCQLLDLHKKVKCLFPS